MDPTDDLARIARSRRNTWLTWVDIHARSKPDEEAFRFLGQSTSWSRLRERINRAADGFARRGVGFGDRVMIIAPNCLEYMEAVLATNSLGAIAVPVDFRLTPPELALLVDDCEPTVVVSDVTGEPLVSAVRSTGTDPGEHIVIGGTATPDGPTPYADILVEGGPAHEYVDVSEETPALIMYTPGTSDRPKGAVLSYENLTAQSLTWIRTFAPAAGTGRTLCSAPMSHIAALGAIAPNLQLGMPTIIALQEGFSPSSMLDLLSTEKITSVFLSPARWYELCGEQQARPRELFVENIAWGGAPASEQTVRDLASAFPGARVAAVFGQAEMSAITCSLVGDDAIRKPTSVGTVAPTVEARVVDELMNDVPGGHVGEIVYRGPSTMQCYWRNATATAEAFSGGWFHSGDLAYMDEEGFVYLVNRREDLIVSAGQHIYPSAVENAITGLERIREVALIGRVDARWGEIPIAVVALESSDPGAELTLEELTDSLRGQLAAHELPRDLVVVDALPRNSRGKVLRHQLRRDHGTTAVEGHGIASGRAPTRAPVPDRL